MEQIKYFRPPPVAFSEIEQRLRGIVDSRIYTKGRYLEMLEDELQAYLNVDHVIVTGSGSTALFIAMKVMRLFTGDNTVMMPAFNWSSDKISAEAAGYTDIKYCDIDPETWLIDHADNTANAVLLDTFGSIDMREPERLNNSDYAGYIIDATHSVGINGIWDRGIACCGSMAPTKNLTSGEGGFIACEDNRVAQRCMEIRDVFSRLPETSCVIALEYLHRLDELISEKRRIAAYYRKHLPYQFQEIPHDSTHSKICFLCDNSEEVIARAAAAGVECRKYYKPLADLPCSNYVQDHIVCLPAWAGVDVKKVVDAVTGSVTKDL